MVSLLASFVLSFFPLDVLDEIWDVIESVSEGFLTYSSMPLTIWNFVCLNLTMGGNLGVTWPPITATRYCNVLKYWDT